MHARFGLKTGFLSPDWFECVRAAVAEAGRLGLEAWIYDEYAFPSGIGAFEVTDVRDFRGKFLDCDRWTLEGGEHCLKPALPGEIAAVAIVPASQPHAVPAALSFDVAKGHARVVIPEGTWETSLVLRGTFEGSGPFFAPDYLSREAMALFFRVCLDPWAEAVGEHFGQTIVGVFTDEPAITPWHQEHPATMMCHGHRRLTAWGTELEQQLGLSPGEAGLHLFHRGGDPDVRARYQQLVAELYVGCFLKPYRDWCDAHNLQLTGHMLIEEGLHSNLIFSGDIIRSMSHFDVPGSDHLGRAARTGYGGGAIYPVETNMQGHRLAASIAHGRGTQRAMCECFGCGGWDLTLADMKWIADFLLSHGLTLLVPHAMFYSLEGFRKEDAPPSQFSHAPYASEYKLLSDHIGRAAAILESAAHAPQVAVLYPLAAMQRDLVPGEETGPDAETERRFSELVQRLIELHYDLEIVSEERLAMAAVVSEGDRLLVESCGEQWQAVLVPACTTLAPEALGKLGELLGMGGAVGVLGEPSPALGLPPIDDLKAWLEANVAPAIRVSSPHVGVLCKRRDGARLFFVANHAFEDLGEVTIEIPDADGVQVLDTETSEVRGVAYERTEAGIRLAWRFLPAGSVLLEVPGGEAPSPRPSPGGRGGTSRPSPTERGGTATTIEGPFELELTEPNALPLTKWALALNGLVFRHTTEFALQYAPARLDLLLDDIRDEGEMGEMRVTAQLNGEALPVSDRWFLDPGFRLVDLLPAARQGRNQVTVTMHNSAWCGRPKGMVGTPKLLGDFRVVSPEDCAVGELPASVGVGDLSALGLPFYTGTVRLATTIELPPGAHTLVVDGAADYPRASLNGCDLGARPWPPYEFDISNCAQAGENALLLEVVSNAAPFMVGQPRPWGLLEAPRIVG
jgi:hypothetical protein